MIRNRRFLPALLLGLVAVLVSSTALAERKLLDKVVAIVNDGVILQSELETRMQTISSRLQAQGAGLPPESVLRERVLDKLIIDSIQLQMADRMGMRVSDNELNQTMRNIAGRNNMTLDQFEQQLAREGLSYRQAREQIREEMLISRVQQRQVDNRVRVTPKQIENFIESRKDKEQTGEEYKLAHILVAVDDTNNKEEMQKAREKAESLRERIVSGTDFQQVAVAESDGSNALEGGLLGWRTEDQLPSLVSDVAPGLPVGQPSKVLESGSGFHLVAVLDKRGGDGGSKLVTQHKTRHILIRPEESGSRPRARKTILELHSRLQSGEDFAELAREFSHDPVSGNDGGSLGWVTPGEMVPAFEQVMTSIAEGRISEPFQSRFGWHILQVQERRQKDMKDRIEEAEARQTLYRRQFETELQNWLRDIRAEAFIEIKGESEDSEASES